MNALSIACRAAMLLGLLALANIAAADFAVVNNTNERLHVASGHLVAGRIVYVGWTQVDPGRSLQVAANQNERLMLSVVSQRPGGLHSWAISNSLGWESFVVSANSFRCEQRGGLLHEWLLTDQATNRVYRSDDQTPWPAEPSLLWTTFYAVPGNLDQIFVP